MLRALTFVAYQPALFSPDSRFYIRISSDLEPSEFRPIGYAVFLRALPLESGYAVVPLVQHLFGLVAAGVIYALALRLTARRGLAAIAAAPLLLDGFQLNIEQFVLSETLFEVLLVGAVALLLWRRPLGVAPAAAAGVLLAASAITRTIGLLGLLPALVAVLLLSAPLGRRARVTRAAAFAAPALAIVGAYAVWFHSLHGEYAITGRIGADLYSRVAPWVDCDRLSLPPRERVVCPKQPAQERPRVYDLVWTRESPLSQVPRGTPRDRIATRFAEDVIAQEPLAYARAVASDFLYSFSPTKGSPAGGFHVDQWRFQAAFPRPFPSVWSPAPPAGFEHGEHPHVVKSLASFLRVYQRFVYAPGPLLALGLVAGLVAAVGLGRAGDSGLRAAAFLLSGLDLAVCLGALFVSAFSWRYQIPQIALLPPSLAIGGAALSPRFRSTQKTPPVRGFPQAAGQGFEP